MQIQPRNETYRESVRVDRRHTAGTKEVSEKWKQVTARQLAGRRLQKVDEVKSVEQLKRGGVTDYKDTTEELAMKNHRFVLPA